jgi:hypothetical protein
MGTERERTRINSKVDSLPDDIRKKLDEMLARTGGDYLKYEEIAEDITEMGYSISRSAIGRYAIKNNSVVKRLKEARLRTEMLLEAVKDNQDIEGTEIATAMFVDQLVQRMAVAEDDIENLPIEKAAKLMIAIQRSAVYKEKFKKDFNKIYKKALTEVKEEMRQELKNNPEIFDMLINFTNKVEVKIAQKLEVDSNG